MGIFNLFNKRKKGSTKPIDHHPEIVVSEIDNGSHGDNIGGLIGKENMRIPTLKKDMKISGLLWFQGEIA